MSAPASRPARSFARPRSPGGPRGDAARAWSVSAALVAGILALALADLASGRYAVSLGDVARTLLGLGNSDPASDPASDPMAGLVVLTLRLPRVLVGLMAGAALGVSGLLLQALSRNPLASPGLVGINAGASAAAVATLLAFPAMPAAAYPAAALAGGLGVAGAVFALSWDRGPSPTRFLLVGVGAAACCAALTSLLLTRAAPDDAQAALGWLVGSLHGRSWPQAAALGPWLAALLPLAALQARALDAAALGHDVAAGLGVATARLTALSLLASAGLAAAAVATVGALGFVGLVAPHLARALVGPRHAFLLPVTALAGAALVLAADMAGRLAFAPVQLPAGVVTALVGVPYFLWLLRGRHA
jgi:iron complex transport system permease protein